MFWYLFVDLAGDAEVGRKALDAAAASRAVIDAAIAQRKASGVAKDDVLGRCLVLQKAGQPGMDDLGIRNNLIGLFIGAIPTISKACVQALDQLLDRPQALASAQAAARSGNDALLAAHVFEAFRFNPINPLIYRRAARDARIAAGSLRSRLIPKGSMVLAVNLSAMFDPLRVARAGIVPHRPAVGRLHPVGLRHAHLLRRPRQPRRHAGDPQAAAGQARPAPRRRRRRPHRRRRHAVPAAFQGGVGLRHSNIRDGLSVG